MSQQKKELPPTVETGTPKPISRRALIRGAATAAPLVLTLHSGAALARSSNLIGPAQAGTTDAAGNTLCLDTTTARPAGNGMKLDLGHPAYARVNVVPQRRYYSVSSYGYPRRVNPSQACQNGGTYYYREKGWHKVKLPRNGIIVSATALHSVASRGDIIVSEI